MQRGYRLNIQVVCEALLLLAVTLGTLAYFSHKVLRQEAMRDAEQTLDGTVLNIDNILLGVEQSTGNIYYDLLEHLDDSDRMFTYSQELVKSNPNIVGCAIAFKPGYYPGKELFMAYVHRKSSSTDVNAILETSETFADRPYTEQVWYSEPMKTGDIGWLDPLKGIDAENEPLITFCLPFSDKSGQRVGVIAVDVSINNLSKIILAAKPSENGYTVLLANNGSYIVHPDKEKLSNPSIFSQSEEGVDISEIEAAKAMLAGESGMREFHRGSHDWYVFFKPFKRSEWVGRANGTIGWSVGAVYPKKDIFGAHNILLYLVLGIAIAGILLFFLLSNWIFRRQLKPLKQLLMSTQHIANGDYNIMLPYSDRHDEIGLLQNRFEQMQRSLQNRVDEQKAETVLLHQQGNMLRVAYNKTIESDGLKTSFLKYLTHQMVAPVESIDSSAIILCNNFHGLSNQEIELQIDNILRKTQTMVELLNHMTHFTESDNGKEADHE